MAKVRQEPIQQIDTNARYIRPAIVIIIKALASFTVTEFEGIHRNPDVFS